MKNYLSPPVLKGIIVLGLPLLAGRFAHYLMSLADTAMVGRLGTVELAAIALGGLFTSILFTFLWPVRTGVQAITSRRKGRIEAGQNLVLEEVLTNGLAAAMIAAALGFLVSFSAGPLLRLLRVDEKIIPLTLAYIGVLRWSLPLFGVVQASMGFLAGVRRTGDIMVVTIGTNVLNVLFNYLLIFGKAGFPALGIRGAALGTLLAEAAGAVYLIYKLGRLGYLVHFRPAAGTSYQGHLIQDVFHQAIPIGIQNIGALGIFMIYEIFVGKTGTAALAATHVLFSLYRVNKTIVGGFSQSSAILVGNHLGAGDVEGANRVMVNCEFLSAIIGAVVFAAVLIFPEPIVSVFTTDPETIAIGVRAMRFFAPFFFIEILGYSFEMIFTSNGWPRFVLISEFTTNVVFILGATALGLFVFGKGLTWAWASFGLYQLSHAAILTAGYFSKKWAHLEVERVRPAAR